LKPFSIEAVTANSAGTAFLATPHEVSAEIGPKLLDAGLRVIDLSGAFRFSSAETFSSWYKLPAPHQAHLGDAVYGLPELYADIIPGAKLVANPGCYATSVILALRPLTQAGLVSPTQNVICDCKSGASGAGKEPRRDLHFVEVGENFRAYNLFSHRHTPGNCRAHRPAGNRRWFFQPTCFPCPRHPVHDLRDTGPAANTASHRRPV